MKHLTSLPALARTATLLGLYSLDLLDLYGKVVWIGPTESFSFDVVHEQRFEQEPLPRPAFVVANSSAIALESGAELLRASGWTSYYEKCSELYATKSNERFDMIKAVNCDLGAAFAADTHVAGELILSASIRADSVAWVGCQLLFFHRRPPLCQENLVTLFPQRYQLPEGETSYDKMAPINSMAEAELLKLLSLLSRSHPLSDVVCAQGFESTAGPGHYDVAVFGCGSPNVFESAFVGVYARAFAELHDNLSWLAVDKLNIMGFELVSRQNSRSQFILREKDGELVVMEESATNFASFGHLYVVLVIVDIILVAANVRAAFETSGLFRWRTLLGFNAEDDVDKGNWMLLYRSLYHSSAIAALTMFSSLTSWLVTFPFAHLWCDDADAAGYAVLSALRVWILVLCMVILLWSVFVRLSESRAYNLAKSSFVTPLEVFVLSAFVIFLETGRLFDVAKARRQLDGQQVIDKEGFAGRLAVANAYSEDLDGFATTTPRILHELFAPLGIVVAESLALIALVLVVKSIYYRHRIDLEKSDSVAVVDFDDTDEQVSTDRTAEHYLAAPLLTRHRAKLYHRLPLEELLQTPARANSLVRGCYRIDEVEEDNLTYMLPHVYYAFGIVVSDAGFLRTRRGFSNVIQRRLDVEIFFAPLEDTASTLASTSTCQRIGDGHAASRAKFALNSVPSPVDAIATAQGSPSPPRVRSELRPTAMSRPVRRRKSMEGLPDNSSPKF
ncbi:hypothetical protein PRIC1_013895 [Phytophthora ramorum]